MLSNSWKFLNLWNLCFLPNLYPVNLWNRLGGVITQGLTMDQHKVDFSTLLSELHAEDHLFISLIILLIVKDPYDCFNI